MKLTEELSQTIVETLLDHKGFENFWYDLEDEVQDEIIEDIEETIREWLDE